MKMLPSDAQELFKNRVGTLYQSNVARRFYLDFQGSLQSFSAKQFNQVKSILDTVDPENVLMNHSLCDTEVVYLPSMDLLLVMRVHEILGLKDLFDGAATMLDLTAILYTRIYNVLI